MSPLSNFVKRKRSDLLPVFYQLFCSAIVVVGLVHLYLLCPPYSVMGPGANQLPTRPRFSWDAKSPPWTDGKGNQERFNASVFDWKEYHDSLPDSSSNKLPSAIQGLVLSLRLLLLPQQGQHSQMSQPTTTFSLPLRTVNLLLS